MAGISVELGAFSFCIFPVPKSRKARTSEFSFLVSCCFRYFPPTYVFFYTALIMILSI